MKLKTLKDFDFDEEYIEKGIKAQDLIKAEAVKWVKHIQKHLDETKLPQPIRLLEEGQLPFIKMFFNITEEDLK